MARFDGPHGGFCVCTRERCTDECKTYRAFHPKPVTNYDRIVSKSPEELAVWLAQQKYRRPRFDGWLPLCNHVMGAKVCHAHGYEACWLDWLKEEAEGGTQ